MTDAKRSTPTDNLVRAWGPAAIELRAGTGDGNTMHGHFAVFDTFTEISSWFEGNFMERIAPGAFTDTFKARGDQIRVLYDHGADPMVGNKPLGAPDVLREDKTGAYYEVNLFPPEAVGGFDVKPALSAHQLGASFRFKVTADQWVTPKEPSRDNPKMLDERTITGVDLYEFGPVTFPAYPDASAGLRSRTDEFIEHFLNDPQFVARFKERAGPAVVEQIRASIPPTAEPGPPEAPTAPTEPEEPPSEVLEAVPDETADGGETDSRERREALLERKTAAFHAHLERIERSQP